MKGMLCVSRLRVVKLKTSGAVNDDTSVNTTLFPLQCWRIDTIAVDHNSVLAIYGTAI